MGLENGYDFISQDAALSTSAGWGTLCQPPSLSGPFSVTWEAAGLAAAGDEIHPYATVSKNDVNTCMVIRAVY